MYITCQQCSTIFRLDEKLLKPTGSKVRCSQCRDIFVAYPPEPVDDTPAVSAPAAAAVAAPTSEAALDQELEGIDLAELDSILEQGSPMEAEDTDTSRTDDDDLADFDEADLDLDFEAALEGDEDVTPPVAEESVMPEVDELDLNMDFDLNGEDDATIETTDDIASTESAGDLNDEINLALDDFEDALGQPDTMMDEAAEISDEDLNLDFELEAEPAESTPVADETDLNITGDDAAIAPETGDDDLELGDLDDLLDEVDTAEETEPEDLELFLDDGEDLVLEEVPVEDTPAPVMESDDLDLGDLDAMLDADDGVEEADVEEADVEEMELSLDDSEVPALDDAPAEDTPAPAMEGDDLDLGDLDALLDDDDGAEDIDVEEVELTLDDGTEPIVDTVSAEGEASFDDDLDLGDLDELLDADDASDDTQIDEDMELSLDDGEVPTLDQDAAMEVASDVMDDDDLGLGDLDALLDVDGPDEDAASPAPELSLDDDSDSLDLSNLDQLMEEDPAPADEGDEIDLSLELESPETKTAEQSDDLEDLEFELDSEFEDKPVSQTAKPVEPQQAAKALDEELDLTDIEQMLEDDTLVQDGATAESETDLEGGAEKWLEDEEDDLGLGGEGEIDLSEIEEAIDAADDEIDGSGILDEDDGLELDLDLDTNQATAEPEAEELDLELEMESATGSISLETEEEESDELDLSDLDLSVEDEKSSTTTETIDAGDIELEFQIEEDAPLLMTDDELDEAAAHTTAAASGATTEAADAEDYALEETIATEPVKPSGPGKPKAPKKKGASKSLVFILILALLGGGGYFGYDYVKKNDIQIPYLSDYINPKPKDPTGTMNLSTLEINSKFLENEKSGRLFVVTGKVRNGYSVSCKMVRLRGKLFTKGKVLSKTEHTYAGVMVPDQELASNPLVDIKKQLNSSLGAAAAVQIRAGQTIPFMVVFSELPDDLDEFAIELVSATKIQ